MFKKIFLFMLLCLNSYSFMVVPDNYKTQIKILKDLDIKSDFITDPIFIEVKEDIKYLHSKTLIDTMREFYKITPIIRKIISQEGLPEEILYLAIVESGLKTASISKAKAVGVWQLMRPTASSLGLRIDAYVDERKDVIKSTYAALNYLKSLKQEFGKWYLAIFAYNCGNGKLRQAIKKANSDDLVVLLDPKKKYLSLETRNFIRKILTLAFLANDKEFLLSKDSSLINYSVNNDFVKVEIPSSVALKDLAKSANLKLNDLKKYNPQFRHSFTPPGNGYYMYIPYKNLAYFNKKFDPKKIAKVDTTIPMTKIYIVKSGDSLYKIARANKTSVEAIRELNKIKKNNLKISQKLIIPIKKEKKNEKHTKIVIR